MTIVDGIPVTSVSRTLLDLATVLSESALERAAKQAVVERVFDLREMEDLFSGPRGTAESGACEQCLIAAT